MKTLVAAALAFLCSVTALGCGGGAAVKCPGTIKPTTVPGSDFVGIPDAEDGAVCLTEENISGLPFLGTYDYDDFGTRSEPRVVLDGATNSTFQAHGVTPRPIEWGVAVDQDGKAIGQTGEGGAIVYLFFKYTQSGTTACTPGVICDPDNPMTVATDLNRWQAAQLSISFPKQEMYVYGERILSCQNAKASCATSEAALKPFIHQLGQ
jgi:hypothetical protein